MTDLAPAGSAHRAATDALRKALAYRLGITTLQPLDQAADLTWLADTAAVVVDAYETALTDPAREPTIAELQRFLRRAGLRLDAEVVPDAHPAAS